MSGLRLRCPQQARADQAVGTGLHALVPAGGGLDVVADGEGPVQLKVDRRGAWLSVADPACGVHVNGRRVRRLAMLRIGDTLHVDGVAVQVLGPVDVPRRLPEARSVDMRPGEGRLAEGGPRLVLRGVGGQHHGRCFELGRPRTVGRLPECDVRIDSPAFADRHARLEPHGEHVLLRGLSQDDATLVNGESVRDAVLSAGDQVVFDAHHRFVLESPGRPAFAAPSGDGPSSGTGIEAASPHRPHARRLPWLLLAALLIAAALASLLLFGAAP